MFDPNVVISALLSRDGSPAKVLLAWKHGEFEAVASRKLLDELERALGYPKLRRYISADDAIAALRWLADGAIIVADPTGEPPVRSEDSDNDYLIALAATERAVLVSGDKHLLKLAGRIPVYSPRQFLHLPSAA